jgi:hypothetical protein
VKRRIYGQLRQFPRGPDLLTVIDEEGYKRALEMAPTATTAERAVGLWATRADPSEQVDLSASLPVRAAYDEQLLAHWLVAQAERRVSSGATPPPTVEMTEEAERGLRALGYLQ